VLLKVSLKQMKRKIALLVVLVPLMWSCSTYSCPTYSGSTPRPVHNNAR
jgi:hypothetical protein